MNILAIKLFGDTTIFNIKLQIYFINKTLTTVHVIHWQTIRKQFKHAVLISWPLAPLLPKSMYLEIAASWPSAAHSAQI